MTDIGTFPTQQVYDTVAPAYASAQADFWPRPALRMVELAGLAPADQIVDFGCGHGPVTLEAARRAPDGWVIGVDISRPMLDWARRAGAAADVRNVSFIHRDAAARLFAPETADRVLSVFGPVMFAGSAAAASDLIATWWALLRPGGTLALACLADFFGRWFDRYLDVVRKYFDPAPLMPWTETETMDALRWIVRNAGIPRAKILYEANETPLAGRSDWERIIHSTGIEGIDNALRKIDPHAPNRVLDAVQAAMADESTTLTGRVHYIVAHKPA